MLNRATIHASLPDQPTLCDDLPASWRTDAGVAAASSAASASGRGVRTMPHRPARGTQRLLARELGVTARAEPRAGRLLWTRRWRLARERPIETRLTAGRERWG